MTKNIETKADIPSSPFLKKRQIPMINFGPSRRISLLAIIAIATMLPAAWAQLPAPIVQLTSSPNPAVQGQPVSFTAYVTQSGEPVTTGSVDFLDGGQIVASTQLGVSGAVWQTSTLSVGVHTIVASYIYDANSPAAVSRPLAETILSSFTPTSTTVRSSQNPSSVGQSVTFTAQITAPNSSTSPSGLVTFYDGDTSIGTAPIVTSGTGEEFFHYATLPPIASLTPGSHPIHARYAGNNIYSPSTSAILGQVVQVSSFPTTTTLSSSLNPSIFGQLVNFTMNVTSASGIPSGKVDLNDGTSLLGELDLDATGQTTITTTSLTVGSHNLTATYKGDVDHASSASPTLNQVVQPAHGATNMALTSSPNPSALGGAVTLTATVALADGTATAIPAGPVEFREGSNVLGTTELGAAGTASFTILSPTAGLHTFSSFYDGNNNFGPSSAGVTQVVNPPLQTSSMSLTSSANPSSYGHTLTISAAVSGAGSGIPTGTVTFEAASTTSTGHLDSAGKTAFTTSALPVGTSPVVAVYSGDSSYGGNTAQLDQVVDPAATQTNLVSSANPSSYGQPVTFTATVTAGNGLMPTGTVTFNAGIVSSPVALDSSGTAVFTISSLPAGTTSVTAAYSGNNNFLQSTFSVNEVVSKASTATALVTSPPSPSLAGSPVQFRATVTSGVGVPTGSVKFNEQSSTLGTVALDSSGHAKLTVPNLGVGSHSVAALYGGDNNYGGSSATITQTVVSAADLAIAKLASSTKVRTRDSVTYSIRVTNRGPSTARSVVVNDALPAGEVFMRLVANRGRCSTPVVGRNGSLSCRLDSFSTTGGVWSIAVTVRVTARAGSVLTNTARVTSSTADPNLANNHAAATIKVVVGP